MPFSAVRERARYVPARPRHLLSHLDSEAQTVISIVADAENVARSMFFHQSRCRARVAAGRQLAMYLMHVVLGRTLTEIGAAFGRDRTTVSHACGRIEDLRDDPEFDRRVTSLEELIAFRTSDRQARLVKDRSGHATA